MDFDIVMRHFLPLATKEYLRCIILYTIGISDCMLFLCSVVLFCLFLFDELRFKYYNHGNNGIN